MTSDSLATVSQWQLLDQVFTTGGLWDIWVSKAFLFLQEKESHEVSMEPITIKMLLHTYQASR